MSIISKRKLQKMGSPLTFIFVGLFILLHLWTVFLAFNFEGPLYGFLSLLLPVVAEIYWVVELWHKDIFYSISGIICLLIALLLAYLKD